MKLLLLGGTADARRMVEPLHRAGIEVIYSVAGLVRQPNVPCAVVSGGFRQFGGLTRYLQKKQIDWMLDATHPYAQKMSAQAVYSARELGLPCWRFLRAPWSPEQEDIWIDWHDIEDLYLLLKSFRRPFFSAGQLSQSELEQLLHQGQPDQLVWRTAVAPAFALQPYPQVIWQKAIGPFAEDDERQLLLDHKVDVVISKNSGGEATYAKLLAARERRVPVLMQRRPERISADREFDQLLLCVQALLSQMK